MTLKIFYYKVINKFLMNYGAIKYIKTNGNNVYLTFDDGPEPNITKFVLDELDKYGFKATFFCKGENAKKYPALLRAITKHGHTLGNHSYEHKHSYQRNTTSFLADVKKADTILHTHLFRPPNGCLKLSAWLQLRKKYKIIYWSIGSGDSQKETFDYDKCMSRLKNTKAGDIVLFHFSEEHQDGTRMLLPTYLKWLKEQGLTSQTLINI